MRFKSKISFYEILSFSPLILLDFSKKMNMILLSTYTFIKLLPIIFDTVIYRSICTRILQGVSSFYSSVPLQNAGERSDGWAEMASPRVKLGGQLIDVALTVEKRSIKHSDDDRARLKRSSIRSRLESARNYSNWPLVVIDFRGRKGKNGCDLGTVN